MQIHSGNGVASLLQIQSRSNIDTQIYGHDSYFTSDYLQHTAFDRTLHVSNYDSNVIRHIVQMNEQDMIGNVMLKIKVPRLPDGYVYANHLGNSIIKHVRIYCAENELVMYTGNYLHTVYQLHTKVSKHKGVKSMNGSYASKNSLTGDSCNLYVDIPFLKTEDDVQYLPTFDSNQNLIIEVVFNPLEMFVQSLSTKVNTKMSIMNDGSIRLRMNTNDVSALKIDNIFTEIMYDSISLTNAERYMFLSKTYSILYKQIQYREERMDPYVTEMSMNIRFSQSVSHLIIEMTHDTDEMFLFKPIRNLKIVLNGVIFNEDLIHADEYRVQKTSYTPTTYLYVIPFCINYNTSQPSGTFSFDGYVKNELPSNKNMLHISRDVETELPVMVRVYAVSYNVINVRNGVMNLKYL